MKKVFIGFVLGIVAVLMPVAHFTKKHRDFVVPHLKDALVDAMYPTTINPKHSISYIDYTKRRRFDNEEKANV